MRVLYLGVNSGNSALQSRALERMGHDVVAVDPTEAIRGPLVSRWAYHSGHLFLADRIDKFVRSRISHANYDVVLVDQGDFVGPETANWLKTIARRSVLLCKDNPFTRRDGGRFRLLLEALPSYDLFVTFRDSSAQQALLSGAHNVRRAFFMADEVIHTPQCPTASDYQRFGSEVSFVGTWMPERGPFVERLLSRGVPLRVFGPRWERAPNYGKIKQAVTLGSLNSREYAMAIACSKIAIGLLSKGNEDLHTTRSIEVPSIGTLLCAERTADHLSLYEDGHEVVLWNNTDDCADVCIDLLRQPEKIRVIAAAGHNRALQNGHFNGPVLHSIISEL